jgi:hypothetical protein
VKKQRSLMKGGYCTTVERIPIHGDTDDALTVVRRIRARGEGQEAPRPPREAVAALIAHLKDEEPLTAHELAAHEREWLAIEAEALGIEQADSQRDRRHQ